MNLKTLAVRRLAYLTSLAGVRRYRALFPQIETCCLFFGYPRSGHSLVGSLINAHRHAVIAHELDLVQYVRMGLDDRRLFALILLREEWFGRRGRQWTGYDYTVPGQWQGRFETLRVVGDKRGSGTTRALKDPRLLDQVRAAVARPLRFILVARNPFDNISTMYLRRKGRDALERVVRGYFRKCGTNAKLVERIGRDSVHQLHLEDLIADPKPRLAETCRFLGLDAPEDYLEACAGILFKEPRRTRKNVEWSEALVGEVEGGIERFDFLAGYRWNS